MASPHLALPVHAKAPLSAVTCKPISLRHRAILLGHMRVIGQETVCAYRLDQHETANRNMRQ